MVEAGAAKEEVAVVVTKKINPDRYLLLEMRVVKAEVVVETNQNLSPPKRKNKKMKMNMELKHLSKMSAVDVEAEVPKTTTEEVAIDKRSKINLKESKLMEKQDLLDNRITKKKERTTNVANATTEVKANLVVEDAVEATE